MPLAAEDAVFVDLYIGTAKGPERLFVRNVPNRRPWPAVALADNELIWVMAVGSEIKAIPLAKLDDVQG